MMTQTDDKEYLARRHRESVERAEAATDPSISRIHRQFAQHYAAKLDLPPETTIQPV